MSSTRERLKINNKTPQNGLALFCGTVCDDGKNEKKIVFDFEPYKPLNTTLYKCDNVFHVNDLKSLLDSNDKWGFIIMDGNGCLFGTLQGNAREVVQKFTVELPKKHGRGGQSSVRFARLRIEKRHNYVTKVAETAVQVFITNDRPNVKGLILAGSADFKTVLSEASFFDIRLKERVVKVIDICYGGENGFTQAIEYSRDVLEGVKIVQEQKLIGKLIEEINIDC
jgi:peptide chain release factor subunit 1